MITHTDEPTTHRMLLSRGEFHQALRQTFERAANVGCRELFISDPDFSDWPLSEPAVIDSLTRWALPHRRLTVLAPHAKCPKCGRQAFEASILAVIAVILARRLLATQGPAGRALYIAAEATNVSAEDLVSYLKLPGPLVERELSGKLTQLSEARRQELAQAFDRALQCPLAARVHFHSFRPAS
jgi:hypothetical protein